MKIQSSVAPTYPKSTQKLSQQASQQEQSLPSSDRTTVDVFEAKSGSSRGGFLTGAINTGLGALEGAGLAVMTNYGGFAATTVGYSAGGALTGAVGGYRAGKQLSQNIKDLGVAEEKIPNFARSEAFKGGLSGASDNFTKAAIVSGVTTLSGGNIWAGVAAGAALGAINIF